MLTIKKTLILSLAPVMLAACSQERGEPVKREDVATNTRAGQLMIVRDTVYDATFAAHGVAEAYARATVSTKLMGSVTAVLVREGDRVVAGQPLVRIDARDIEAKRLQLQASIASAEAMHREATLMATRMRALYADSAVPRAQVDAADAALSRATAGVSAAHAGEAELNATAGYAVVRAPFAGVVTQRLVDPGAFAAPGTPLITIQDDAHLRLTTTIDPSLAQKVRRGMKLDVSIEGQTARATVEGVVPSAGGSLNIINAIVDNGDHRLPLGGAATISVRTGTQRGILVPSLAIRRDGDLNGVTLAQNGASTRWLKLGRTIGASVEVLSGLASGDSILVPERVAGRP